MNNLQNLHTHTTYCDGIDTPEQMIKAALQKGFDSIGFSGHSYMFYSPSHSMSIDGTEQYKKEITLLKSKYKDKIDVFLGLEVDMYSDIELNGYEYLIGSCHYLKIGDEYVGFDRSADEVRNIINTYFNGDGLAFAKEYYKQFSNITDYGNFDIIGHFDLITKNIEIEKFFDINSEEYLSCAIECAKKLSNKIPFFEVNTGAISRGYRTSPYPTKKLLTELKKLGLKAVISSDCHDAKHIDCAFDDAKKLLLQCGFTEHYILTKKSFKPVKL